MAEGPFLEDPRDVIAEHIARAVSSPLEEVRAIHLRAAEHHAEIARASKLPLKRGKT
jgi:hypothetical protein